MKRKCLLIMYLNLLFKYSSTNKKNVIRKSVSQLLSKCIELGYYEKLIFQIE